MNLKHLMLTGLLLLCSVFTFSKETFQWKKAHSGGYTYEYVTNDPSQARFYKLKNGLTVILSPTNKKPRIQAYVAVKAGSKTDPASNTGLAHYLEHMMFKGTDKYGTLDWQKEQVELAKIDALYEQYNKTTDEAKRKAIYQKIDSISSIASKYAIANEYDRMMTAMGAQGTNAFTSFEQTVYIDDIPANALNKYLMVQAERFRNPVLRLFHTELEAVYEEKNISMDRDGSLIFETLFSNLFPNHNYGQQTTIGTVEHLKNPSLIEIRKYFNTYYVPNNMALILSGDFNPDTAIALIDKYFSYMQEKAVPKYTFEKEKPITQPIIKKVYSHEPENLLMAFRLPGTHHEDALIAELVGSILTNGKAGLIDQNLVQQQKLLYASAATYTLIDYGVLLLGGNPIEGQSLDEVQQLLLEQVENLKKGNFGEDLIKSIVNNYKKDQIQTTESYNSRASSLMYAFTSEKNWRDVVASIDNLSKITKQDIVNFANKYLGNNYVSVHKLKGERVQGQKIEKPQITPIETNRDKQSDFLQMVNKIPTDNTQPLFLNFEKDIQKGSLGKAEILYVPNTENSLYRLHYRYKIGSLNNLKLSTAAALLPFLGTDEMSAMQINQEFYKIASSFQVNVGEEYTTVTIEGLQENFEQALSLYENLMAGLQPDDNALQSLKARILKARADSKLNKQSIMQALSSYAMYGSDSKFKYMLSEAELEQLSSQELIEALQALDNHEQTVIYYGPLSLGEVTTALKDVHKVPAHFIQAPEAKKFTRLEQTKNQVFVADYKMVQAEVMWIRTGNKYNPNLSPTIRLFNEYFGGGMGSLVFQTIRESKALAYSTYANYASPAKKEDKYTFVAYVGTQADKFGEATSAMNELITSLPLSEKNFQLSKDAVLQSIETARTTGDAIVFYYLNLKQLGINHDIRKDLYNNIPNMTLEDIRKFHHDNLSNKAYSYVVVADPERLPLSELEKLGEVKKLTLEELFGY